ncbi:putative membrane protein [Dissulfuribacter thermophilus]|uniref:Putative membrane protein n=1 Tax=Dissulfuribacter thermophilus TaxID=1156395 RepID=A0A1B9F2K8_9BACT|nr:putative sulfate exporter family transporter [Dissulfuribacter thermophilus]OCC14169.1 putative membrane protein [Dissulfuribacter thermophilus]
MAQDAEVSRSQSAISEGQKSFIQEVVDSIPGAILVIAVAVAAYVIAPYLRQYPLFKTYLELKDFILAILFGIIIKNTVGVARVFEPGLRFSTILTKTGIVIMGAKYSMMGLVKVGGPALLYIGIFLFGTAIIMMWVGTKLKVPTPLAACLASGLSVCGVSATIAIAPAVRAKNQDMAYSIAVVLMFGLLALLVFPPIGKMLHLTDTQYGAFCGVGIVNSAQVLAAGFGYSEGAGLIAGIYNIGRVIFLPFVVLMLAIMAASREASSGGQSVEINKFKLIIDKFPIFVLGFLLVVFLNTMGLFTKPEVHQAKIFMNWAFLLGFASIGLTTRLADLKAAGLSGFFLGFLVAGLKAALALVVVLTFMK